MVVDELPGTREAAAGPGGGGAGHLCWVVSCFLSLLTRDLFFHDT